MATVQWRRAAELLNENGIGYEHLPETGGKTKPKPEDLAHGIDRIVEIAKHGKGL